MCEGKIYFGPSTGARGVIMYIKKSGRGKGGSENIFSCIISVRN